MKVSPADELVALRQRYASDAANGVPPHITILFPFVPAAQLDELNLGLLRRVIGSFREFDFALTTIGWFGDKVLWLAPENPSPFIDLTNAVTAAFPEYPPYGGVHDSSVPHATVADSVDQQQLDRAKNAVIPILPIETSVAALTVIIEGTDGSWRELTEVPLSSRA